MGIAQFMPNTWQQEWGDPFNVNDAIKAQAKKMCDLTHNPILLAEKKKTNGSTLQLALAAYNGGLGAIDDANGVPNWKETKGYIHNILDWSGLYDGMDPELAKRVKEMLRDDEVHYNLWVRYGFRTYDEQKQLWDAQLAKQGGNAWEAGKWVANPDNPATRSNHLDGLAADINGDQALLQRVAPKYGLCFPVDGESWHVEKC